MKKPIDEIENTDYPIWVKFGEGDYRYTLDGRYRKDEEPTLSLTPYTIEFKGFTQERPSSELNHTHSVKEGAKIIEEYLFFKEDVNLVDYLKNVFANQKFVNYMNETISKTGIKEHLIKNNPSETIGDVTINEYKQGYNKAKEQTSYSKQDMIEFARFCIEKEHTIDKINTFQECLELFEQSRPKTIYFK